MKHWDALGLLAVLVVLLGTPAAVFAGQRYLNAPPHEYTIVAHTAEDGGFVPNRITVVQGEHVWLRLTSADVTHGFAVPSLGIDVPQLYPGKYVTVDFTPQKPGTYPFLCTIVCSPLHYKMQGEIVVLPANDAAADAAAAVPTPAAISQTTASGTVSFRADVQPIFQSQCVGCHTGTNAPAGLDLGSYQSAMRGASGSPVVVPGQPDQSLLVQKVKGTAGARMPFGGQPLPAKDVQRIEGWITEGAPNN